MLRTTRPFLSFAIALLSAPQLVAQDLYSTDFTDLGGWTLTDGNQNGFSWAADATPAVRPCGEAPFLSAPHCLNFNNGIDIGDSQVTFTGGAILSPWIDLSASTTGNATLRFWWSMDAELGCQYDVLFLGVFSSNGTQVHECIDPLGATSAWTEVQVPLDPAWGNVQILFSFGTGDVFQNSGSGPFIDDLRITQECPTPQSYCPSEPNSTGVGARMGHGGSVSLLANDFELRVDSCPAGQFGVFFTGDSTRQVAFGDGLRCVAGGTRFPVLQTDAQGAGVLPVDFGNLPAGLQIQSGEAWYFQFWYRDPFGPGGTGFNLSDGLQVIFCE